MTPPVVNGWTLLAHPCFLRQLRTLVTAVEDARKKDPEGYARNADAKRLKAILTLALDVIPQDPTRPDYRQGDTLGGARKHWFRAKFFQQYRLFFRYDTASRIIIYAWVNDESTKRAYGSRTDAYGMFGRMLDTGHPPDDWATLLREAQDAEGDLSWVSGR